MLYILKAYSAEFADERIITQSSQKKKHFITSCLHYELVVEVKRTTVGFEVVGQLVNSHRAVLEAIMVSLSIDLS